MRSTKLIATLMFAMLLFPGCLSEGFGEEVIEGCTDSDAINFDENANADDQSCEYNIVVDWIEGCMASSAINFNPEAVLSDGSCIFTATGSEIDDALNEVSVLLESYRNGEDMSSSLVFTEINYDLSMEIFSNEETVTMKASIGDNLTYTATENQGIATVCYVESIDCLQHRNEGAWEHSYYPDHIHWTMVNHFNTGAETWEEIFAVDLPTTYHNLVGVVIPAGPNWVIDVDDSNVGHQIATIAGLGGGDISLSATLTIGSVELVSLSVSTWDEDYVLEINDFSSTINQPLNTNKIPVAIDWLYPEYIDSDPVVVLAWGCSTGLVNLDSLEDESTDSVNEVLWGIISLPAFCGELIEADSENTSFTTTGPVFDNRWGTITYIEDPNDGGWKEVVMEIDIEATEQTSYLLDVTSDECSHNGGTYDILTQTCEWYTDSIATNVSNNYLCNEGDWDDSCMRYGINEDGHLVQGWAYERQDDGNEDSEDDAEMIWDCENSVFAEDNTPLGPDSNEDVQNSVSNMVEPEWCGVEIDWNGSFSSDSQAEAAISEKNWNNPDGIYLDFDNTGTLNLGDRGVTQDECSDFGGVWNTIEEACEMVMGEWIANETLIELDFGWGFVDRMRYEFLEGGIVIAFSGDNGSDSETPDMINTFVEGYDEVGYDSFEFIASENGTHVIQSSQDDDGFLYLYATSFDPDFPEQNAIVANDDWYIDGDDDWASVIHWDLEAGMTYVIVTTTYSPDYEMSFNNTILSPDENVVSWSGSIDSLSPVFIRSEGWWEGEGVVNPETNVMMITTVADSHWNNVLISDLEISVYSDYLTGSPAAFVGSFVLSDFFMVLQDGTEIQYSDNDNDGLLSAGDTISITAVDDSYGFLIWDNWANSWAIET